MRLVAHKENDDRKQIKQFHTTKNKLSNWKGEGEQEEGVELRNSIKNGQEVNKCLNTWM